MSVEELLERIREDSDAYRAIIEGMNRTPSHWAIHDAIYNRDRRIPDVSTIDPVDGPSGDQEPVVLEHEPLPVSIHVQIDERTVRRAKEQADRVQAELDAYAERVRARLDQLLTDGNESAIV